MKMNVVGTWQGLLISIQNINNVFVETSEKKSILSGMKNASYLELGQTFKLLISAIKTL